MHINKKNIERLCLQKLCLATVIAISIVLSGNTLSQDTAAASDIFAGHYAREGNNDNPSLTFDHNIYIKLFKEQWIVTLYIPLPYGTNVPADIVAKVLEQVKSQTTTSAYIRGKFGYLSEPATAQVERYGYLEDRIVFECGSLAPCTIKTGGGFLELIKPGMLNEHIVRYTQIVE